MSKKRQRLSETRAKAARAGRSKRNLWCGEVPGFHLVVTTKGAKAIHWYRRHRGMQYRMKLADFGEVDFETARAMAARCNEALRMGEDPRVALRGDPAALTIAEAWLIFVPEAEWSSRTVRENRYLWERHIAPVIGARRLDSVTSGDVSALLARAAKKTKVPSGDRFKIVGGPVASNRARAALSALFSWAIGRGLVETNPVAGTKPRKERPKDRVLRADEIEKLTAALKSAPPYFHDAVMLLVLTACRPGEILGLRWSEVTAGGQAPRLTIPPERAKGRRKREVPLIPEAVEILERRRGSVGGEFVFPSDAASGHLETLKKSWAALIGRAEIESATPHDIRRSVAQAALDAGADFALVSALLGHSPARLGITSVYAQPSLDRVRAALQRGVNRLLGTDHGDVVEFAAR